MKQNFSERLVSRIWQLQLLARPFADSGEELKIVYPGRAGGGGCDFRDAVFLKNGTLTAGDVEVHVESSRWYSHGHHLDPRYNSVALHVVMWRHRQSATVLQNGTTVPTLYLEPYLTRPLSWLRRRASSPVDSLYRCPHRLGQSDRVSLNSVLAAAGNSRFMARVTSFKEALAREPAGQVLFRGIAGALGYSRNKTSCEALASKVTLNSLESIQAGAHAARQALILGTAGLLPSQRARLKNWNADDFTDEIEQVWLSTGAVQAMKESDWCFSGIRPDNRPTRRLAALDRLIASYSETGILPGLLKLVKEAPPTGARRLESGLTISAQGYWANHCDFGLAKRRSSALLGREKAAETAINVILPFAAAWGHVTGDPELESRAGRLYETYPKLNDNELTRHMKQQLALPPDSLIAECHQQGLIHIFKNYCRARNCAACPVTLSQS